MCYTSDNKRMIVGRKDGVIEIWTSQHGALIARIFGCHGKVLNICCSPDNELIAFNGTDQKIRIFYIGSSQFAHVHILQQCTKEITTMCFSMDGEQLASGDVFGSIIIWDVEIGSKTDALVNSSTNYFPITSLCYSPDNKYLVSGSKTSDICIWDTQNGQLIRTFTLGSLGGSTITYLCYLSGGKHIISGSYYDGINIWDPQNGNLIRSIREPDGIKALYYFPYNEQIISVSAGINNKIKIWDANTGTVVREMNASYEKLLNIRCVPYSDAE